jgi:galactose mutarotase-like enzyme
MNPDEPSLLTKIASDGLSAEIHPLGAQLFTLRDSTGRDLLWDGDPAIWSGRAPLLFPIIGSLVDNAYHLDGQTYRLSRHGFARNRLFQLIETNSSSATFRLHWDDETFQVYPFRFALDVTFLLAGLSLEISAVTSNLGAGDMPASFGFHPALRWPLPGDAPRDAHALLFDAEEPAPIRRLTRDGVIDPVARPSPVKGRSLHLRDDLFLEDALIFDRIESRRLWYGAPSGPRIQVDFPDTPCLGVWTKPGANFICIEPWHGYADPEGFSGDFRTKPGIFIVRPGENKRCAMTISLR